MSPSASTVVASPTPSTSEVLSSDLAAAAPSAELPRKKAAPRSGAELWKVARKKAHAYHAVTHQLQHRAQEKAGFAVAEVVLTRAGAYAAHLAEEALEKAVETAAREPAVLKKWWSGVVKLTGKLRSAAGKLRPRRKASPSAGHQLAAHAHHHGAHHGGHHGAHHAAPTGMLGSAFHVLHVAMPLLGTYLIAHMAHHDLHRTQLEARSSKGQRLPLALFCLGTLCDAIDALAHVVIVLCLVLPENAYFNHHVEHELHGYSMYVALVACVAMMVGEALSHVDGHGHGHDHGHGHGHEAARKPAIPLALAQAVKVEKARMQAEAAGAKGPKAE